MKYYDDEDADPSEEDDIMEDHKYTDYSEYSVFIHRFAKNSERGDYHRVLCKDDGVLLP